MACTTVMLLLLLMLLLLVVIRQNSGDGACDAIRREILMQSCADRVWRDAGSVGRPSAFLRTTDRARRRRLMIVCELLTVYGSRLSLISLVHRRHNNYTLALQRHPNHCPHTAQLSDSTNFTILLMPTLGRSFSAAAMKFTAIFMPRFLFYIMQHVAIQLCNAGRPMFSK